MIPESHRAFVNEHRLCVIAWNRAQGTPSANPVFYVTDGDDLLVSITETRQKTRAIRRDPKVAICVLAEEMPFPYVTLFGTATIETEGAAELMMRVMERFTGAPLDPAAGEGVRQRAEREQRVVMRFRADRSTSNIPS